MLIGTFVCACACWLGAETWNNTLYSPSSLFSNGPCKDFTSWQGAGQDRGSKVLPMPAIEDIVAMGKAIVQQ